MRQAVVGGHEQVGDVETDHLALQVVRHRRPQVAPVVHERKVHASRGHEVDRPGWVLLDDLQGDPAGVVGKPPQQGATTPRTAVEKAAIRTRPPTTPCPAATSASSASIEASSSAPLSARWWPASVSMMPRP